MSRTKLKRFTEVETFPNVIKGSEIPKNHSFFDNDKPIILELACGKAEFSLQMAAANPNKNFIGIDRKGERIWRAAKTALDQKLPNIKFILGNIELIDTYFPNHKVSEIWITFPDPHLKDQKAKHRLTHERFLHKYCTVLKQDGLIHLKTDSKRLLDFTVHEIQNFGGNIDLKLNNIYSLPEIPLPLTYQTTFEKRHLANGLQIHYIKGHLPKNKIAKSNPKT